MPPSAEFRRSKFIRSRGEAFASAVKLSNSSCVIFIKKLKQCPKECRNGFVNIHMCNRKASLF